MLKNSLAGAIKMMVQRYKKCLQMETFRSIISYNHSFLQNPQKILISLKKMATKKPPGSHRGADNYSAISYLLTIKIVCVLN